MTNAVIFYKDHKQAGIDFISKLLNGESFNQAYEETEGKVYTNLFVDENGRVCCYD